MNQLQPPRINRAQYARNFRQSYRKYYNSPVQQRQCKDICCLVTFIILSLIMLVGGIYFIIVFANADIQKAKNVLTSIQLNDTMKNSTKVHEIVLVQSEHQNKNQHFSLNSPRIMLTMQHYYNNQDNMVHYKQNQNKKHQKENLGEGFTHEKKSYNLTAKKQPLKTSSTPQQNSIQLKMPNLTKAIPWIILTSILALILSILVVIAIAMVPEYVIYGMIILTTMLIFTGLIVSFVLNIFPLVKLFIVLGIVWIIIIALIFFCYRQKFQIAIVLLKIAGNFLKTNPQVILAPVIMTIITYVFFAFWLASFIGIQFDRPAESLAKLVESPPKKTQNETKTNSNVEGYQPNIHDFYTLVWLFLNVFFNYFIYYVLVFLIATATAIWYYGVQGNFILKGFKNIWKAHIGSLTFAAMIVTIINMLKNAAQNNEENQENMCGQICMSMLKWCLQIIEQIIKVLNHNSVIVMSVTGEDFIGSAKTTIFLIYDNFVIFLSIDIVQFLIKMCVIFSVVVIPTGLGVLLLKLTNDQPEDQQILYLVFGGLIILFICSLIGMLIITLISEALSCIFIFYCLDSTISQIEEEHHYNQGGDSRRMHRQEAPLVNKGSSQLRNMFSSIISSKNTPVYSQHAYQPKYTEQKQFHRKNPEQAAKKLSQFHQSQPKQQSNQKNTKKCQTCSKFVRKRCNQCKSCKQCCKCDNKRCC